MEKKSITHVRQHHLDHTNDQPQIHKRRTVLHRIQKTHRHRSQSHQLLLPKHTRTTQQQKNTHLSIHPVIHRTSHRQQPRRLVQTLPRTAHLPTHEEKFWRKERSLPRLRRLIPPHQPQVHGSQQQRRTTARNHQSHQKLLRVTHHQRQDLKTKRSEGNLPEIDRVKPTKTVIEAQLQTIFSPWKRRYHRMHDLLHSQRQPLSHTSQPTSALRNARNQQLTTLQKRSRQLSGRSRKRSTVPLRRKLTFTHHHPRRSQVQIRLKTKTW